MNGEPTRIERQDFYDEVWATPMVQLSRKYGVSDVALKKVCKKLGIPVPGRGYWRKKEVGQPVSIIPLPTLKDRQAVFAMIRGAQQLPIDPDARTRIASEKQPENRIAVPGTISQPHPLTEEARAGLANASEDKWGIRFAENGWYKIIKVSSSLQERALRIMDALFKAFETRRFALSVDKKSQTLSVVIQDGQTAFLLEELLDRKERELTPTQVKDKERNPWKYRYPDYYYVPSGMLSLKITEPSWDIVRRTWSDGKRQRVEDCLNRFVAALTAAAVIERDRRIAYERRQREQEEEERLAEERRKRKVVEQRKLTALLTDSLCWQRSRQIRTFVRAVGEAAIKFSPDSSVDTSLSDWIAWALKQADSLDPLAFGSYCLRNERHAESSQPHVPQQLPSDFDLVQKRMLSRSNYFRNKNFWHRFNK